MSLSSILSELFPRSESDTESSDSMDSDASIVCECRTCGTNVSAGTTRCPTCDGDDIVTYSIE
nr:hypothetical protein [Halosolutus gelatinilyticus]